MEDVEKSGQTPSALRSGNAIDSASLSSQSIENQNNSRSQNGPPDGGSGGPPPKKSIFHPDLKDQRKRIAIFFGRFYLITIVLLMGILSIYWGSLFKREEKMHKMRIAVVNWDGQNSTYLQDNGLEAYVGSTVVNSLPEGVLGWEIRDDLNNSSIEHIRHLVHDRYYWGAVVIKANATEALHRALTTADSSANLTGIIEAMYEQATDITATESYVDPGMQTLRSIYEEKALSAVFDPLLKSLNSTQKAEVVDNAPALLMPSTQFLISDNLPIDAIILFAPLQIGLIYLIIVSFFQVNMLMPIHGQTAPKIFGHHYVLYRQITAQVSYFIISLFFSLVSLAFQIDTSFTFGKSGFLVFWMVNFLGMSAVGGANENMALLLFAYFPPALGFWLLFWVISNISPAFGPITLCADFYRYGYAFPIYNVLELERVVLCNTTKRFMGRCFGVLVAWIVVNNLLMPITLRINAKKMMQRGPPGPPK
uniref:ARAD1C39688p n=1 Tax=Blastobotrys adeninivorans TaxID=409370 RepID=A0A060T8V5_BLAAD